MKKYYSLMIVVLAFVTGTTGCLFHPATDYGIPWSNDEDAPFYDDFEETEPDEIQTDADNPTVDSDSDDNENIVDINFIDDDFYEGDSIADSDIDNTINPADNFPNEYKGLYWSNISDKFMKWSSAVTYCENLGGRLPTISELRTLIQNCPATETGGECGVSDNCLYFYDCWNDPCEECKYDGADPDKYSVFGDTDILSSSSSYADNTNYTWTVIFGNGNVLDSSKTTHNFVRCVRK